eukprot:NODE_283_length_11832_cov_0.293190.p5 type:complete len:133 gc:universal NODE_283_length_11832_cov_0.293190:7964-8362(+)
MRFKLDQLPHTYIENYKQITKEYWELETRTSNFVRKLQELPENRVLLGIHYEAAWEKINLLICISENHRDLEYWKLFCTRHCSPITADERRALERWSTFYLTKNENLCRKMDLGNSFVNRAYNIVCNSFQSM